MDWSEGEGRVNEMFVCCSERNRTTTHKQPHSIHKITHKQTTQTNKNHTHKTTHNKTDPKILLLNIELELKAEKENAEIRLDDPAKYQSIVDAEWNIIYDKLAKCCESGANIVLSRLAIGDLGTQYFADRGVFCAGRVADDDMQRVAKATGAAAEGGVWLVEFRGQGEENSGGGFAGGKAEGCVLVMLSFSGSP
jgi:hypothetical protein